ncbi:MAG: hypothetical protein C4516_06470 [Oxalobacter sp.]|nr:MAG: hypothetical protein C4516_06470 [Oxalobacter sp.]
MFRDALVKTLFCILMASVVLQGCSNVGKSYSEINPERAEKEVKRANGYYHLKKKVAPGTAKLILRSEGAGHPASFSYRIAQSKCEKFERIGTAAYTGSGQLLPWIAKMTRGASNAMGAKGFLSYSAEPGKPIQIQGDGFSSSSVAGGVRTVKCGPVTSEFVPQEGRAYLVQFLWEGDTCRQVVSDASDPDKPVALNADKLTTCVN